MAHKLTPIEYFRSLLAMIYFTLALTVAAVLIFVIVLLTFGKATNWIVRTFPRPLGLPVLWLLGITFERVDLREHTEQPAIYIFNHSSTLDIPVFLSLGLPGFRVIAKWELQYLPFFLVIGRMTGQVFIKRKDREHAVRQLVKTYERLKRQKLSVVIAPEGSRKHEGKIGPFKKGAFRMAVDLGYPIVPIYFDGNDQLSVGGSLMSKSGTITATIHPAIDTSNWSLENLDEHIDEVRRMYLEWAGVSEV